MLIDKRSKRIILKTVKKTNIENSFSLKDSLANIAVNSPYQQYFSCAQTSSCAKYTVNLSPYVGLGLEIIILDAESKSKANMAIVI